MKRDALNLTDTQVQRTRVERTFDEVSAFPETLHTEGEPIVRILTVVSPFSFGATYDALERPECFLPKPMVSRVPTCA